MQLLILLDISKSKLYSILDNNGFEEVQDKQVSTTNVLLSVVKSNYYSNRDSQYDNKKMNNISTDIGTTNVCKFEKNTDTISN